jgi:hypothetical protein
MPPVQAVPPTIPPQIVIQQQTKKGQDARAGFGKAFGEGMGRTASGCLSFIIIVVIILAIIAIIANL